MSKPTSIAPYILGMVVIVCLMGVMMVHMSYNLSAANKTIALKQEEVRQQNLHIAALKQSLDEEIAKRVQLETDIELEVKRRLQNAPYYQKLMIQQQLYQKMMSSIDTPSVIVTGKVK